jgi:polyisoprenoid-binding protein YceI
VHVWKQGIFAFAADNHVVDAPITSGKFDPQSNSIELNIESAKLRVLDPQLPSDRRAQVQANMLGPQVLDVAKYPEITFHSTNSQATSPGKLTVTGDLTLHGETHAVVVQVVQIDTTHFKGSATVRQSAFGISPIRLAGGTVKVKDDVNVDFDIALKRAAQ